MTTTKCAWLHQAFSLARPKTSSKMQLHRILCADNRKCLVLYKKTKQISALYDSTNKWTSEGLTQRESDCDNIEEFCGNLLNLAIYFTWFLTFPFVIYFAAGWCQCSILAGSSQFGVIVVFRALQRQVQTVVQAWPVSAGRWSREIQTLLGLCRVLVNVWNKFAQIHTRSGVSDNDDTYKPISTARHWGKKCVVFWSVKINTIFAEPFGLLSETDLEISAWWGEGCLVCTLKNYQKHIQLTVIQMLQCLQLLCILHFKIRVDFWDFLILFSSRFSTSLRDPCEFQSEASCIHVQDYNWQSACPELPWAMLKDWPEGGRTTFVTTSSAMLTRGQPVGYSRHFLGLESHIRRP